MPLVEATTSVHRSIRDVFEFIDDLANHGLFLPSAWTNFRLLSPDSIGVGASSAYEMQVGGRSYPVQTVAIESQPPRRYVQQCHGPMEHLLTWQFEAIVDRTRLALLLEYVPQSGFWGRLSDRTVVQPALRRALDAYLINLKFVLERRQLI